MEISKSLARMESRLGQFFLNLFGIDLRALACFRIVLASLLLVDLGCRAKDLTAFYTDDGVLPREVLYGKFPGHAYFSLHALGGSAGFEAALFILHSVFALTLLVGYRTRLSNLLCWLMLVSLDARNPLILQDGDIYFVLLFFWSLFLPLGARWSLDRAGSGTRKDDPAKVVSLGTVAVLLQVLIVYFFSGLYKTSPEWNSLGTAVYLALRVSHYATPWGQSLLAFPGLLEVLTHGILFFEKGGVFLLFMPWKTVWFRCAALLAMAFMHLGFLVFMVLGIFPWVCLGALILFLPSLFWDWVERWKRGEKLGRGIFTGKAGRFIRTLPPEKISLEPSFLSELVAGIFLTYVFLYNYGGLHPGRELPPQVKIPFRFLFLEQRWTMFAPQPMRNDGWIVMVGDLAGGSEVDLWREGHGVSWERPREVYKTYRDDRWHKYLCNLEAEPLSEWPELASYLYRQWRAKNPSSRALKSIEIVFMREKTEPPGRESKLERVSLGRWDCGQPLPKDERFLFPQP